MNTIQRQFSETTPPRVKVEPRTTLKLVVNALLGLVMLSSSYSSAESEGVKQQSSDHGSPSQAGGASLPVTQQATEGPAHSPSGATGAQTTQSIRYQFSLAGEGLRVIAWQGQQAETIAAIALEGQRHQLLEYQRTLYVACDLRGVAVIDVSNPRVPVLRGYVGAGSPVLGIGLAGNTLVASLSGGSQLRYDVTDPLHPALQQNPVPISQTVQRRDEESRLSEDEVELLRKRRAPKRKGVGMTIAGGSVFGALYIWPLIMAPFVDGTLAIPAVGPIVSLARGGSSVWAPLAIIDSVGQAVGLGLLFGGIAQLSAGTSTMVGQRIQFVPYASAGGSGMLAVGHF